MIVPRRVLVTGSRHWIDQSPIYRALYYQRMTAGDAGMVIVHGAANGADTIADHWGQQFFPGSVTVERHPADWMTHGKAAGHIRNQAMVDLGADVCLAFPFPDSRGTKDCMRRAHMAGIEVRECAGYPEVAVTVVVP